LFFFGFIVAGCFPPKNLEGSRLFASLVIEVEVTAPFDSSVPLEAEVSLSIQDPMTRSIASAKPAAPASANATGVGLPDNPEKQPLKATYAIALPSRIKSSDISRIRFTAPGFQPLDIDYQKHEKTTYIPASRVDKGVYRPDSSPCDGYNELGQKGSEENFIKYVQKKWFSFTGVAYAMSYSTTCKVSFRQRDKIKIILQSAPG
jgi:hypothetical protein